jgi:hypothetical protein
MRRPVALNAELFSQIGLDSGTLTMLASIAHPLGEMGTYRGSVRRGDREVGHFHLSVGEDTERVQLNVDLSSAERRARAGDETGCDCPEGETPRLRAGGYLLLHVGGGPGRYAVSLALGTGDDRRVVYDSGVLAIGDRFAATVLRPGRYTVTNSENDASGRLEVAYPERGDQPYVPADPIVVAVAAKSFRPASISVGAAQGQVYDIRAPSRIRITLAEPYDRPRPEGPRYRLVRRPNRVPERRNTSKSAPPER